MMGEKAGEGFDRKQVIDAIKIFLRFGDSHSPDGYCGPQGWAGRCLSWHLECLKREQASGWNHAKAIVGWDEHGPVMIDRWTGEKL